MSQVFTVLFPVFSIILIGYFYGRWRHSDIDTVNRMNIDVFIPALVIDSMLTSDFELLAYKWLILAGVLVVLLSGVIAVIIARVLNIEPRVFVPSMMFNNCGNMGLPVAVLAFGPSALPAAMVLFLASNTLHFTLGTRIVGGKISWFKLLTMPINLAMIIGLLLSFNHVTLPDFLLLPIHMLGQICIPLMLFTLGIRMISVDFSAWRIGLYAAIFRPLSGLIPAIVLIGILPLSDIQQQQLLLFSIFPPAVLNYIFAEQYRQQPINVASMVVVGNASSVITLFAMLYYLSYGN
ncbi:MAG: transporter [Proteobacteria bacterium]|nr:MAG: transporter [Pseudomonadota bacterium]